MQKRAMAAGVLALLVSTSPAHAQSRATAAPDDAIDYQVQRGDTLIDLAVAYLNRPADYRQVQRRNRVANPRRMATGRNLAFPVSLLRADPDQARIASFRGAVSLTQGPATGAPSQGQTVSEGAILTTGANAFVRLALSDGSHVVVPSNSRVRLTRLRRYALNGAVDHAMTVEAGRAESRVTPRQRPGGFVVRTPVSVSAVRGTEFRV
ncbi:MAG: FecR domain-containing protein, partial [Brevundimonas sp.]